jgi:transposase
MLDIEERFMIKELYRKGVSISEIARQSGRDRKTIRKLVNAPLLSAPKPRQPKPCKIDPYVPYLEQRMGEGVFNARKLYGEITTQGYPGGETQVRAFVQERRPPRTPAATVRFETPPGLQGQVDWGHFGLIRHQGRLCKLYGFVLTLSWSRAMYLCFTTSLDFTWFIRCHVHAFAYLGGLPRRLLYDNLKSVVEWHPVDGPVHWNPRFLDFADVAGFSPQACKPRRPQTKGKVENGIKYVRGNFWPGLHFSDLEDLNIQALRWLNTVANCRVHGTTNEVPFARLPKEGLQPVERALAYDTSFITTRRASRDCVISYASNLYSVPAAYAQQSLQIKVTEQEDLIICSALGQEIARHRLLHGQRERSLMPQHYQGLPVPTSPVVRGRPVACQEPPQEASTAPFWEAPVVEIRPLSVYDQVIGGLA